jgi:hypothetical protein
MILALVAALVLCALAPAQDLEQAPQPKPVLREVIDKDRDKEKDRDKDRPPVTPPAPPTVAVPACPTCTVMVPVCTVKYVPKTVMVPVVERTYVAVPCAPVCTTCVTTCYTSSCHECSGGRERGGRRHRGCR